MVPLSVTVDGRTLEFDGTRPLRVGRSIDADVLLTAGSVSRLHAELRPTPAGWVVVDAGSQYGTFVAGVRISEHLVAGPTTVQCGPEVAGSTVTLTPRPAVPTPEQTSLPPEGAPGLPGMPPPPPAPLDQTQILAVAGPPGHTGAPMPRSGPDLLVIAGGREYRYRHPATLRIGRAPENDIVIEDPVCSRQHGQITAMPGAWVYTNGSAEGSFDDGRRVASTRFDERLDLRLGHPVAGPAVSLVPILSAAEEERRFARRRRRRARAATGGVLGVLVLVVGIVVVATRVGGDEPAPPAADDSLAVLTRDELDRAKAATVLLLAETEDSFGGTVQYSGSGSMITPHGLILTNAHVAAPSSPGLAEYYSEDEQIADPDYLLVALTGSDDAPAEPEYRARPVAADGVTDVAVMQIYATADGTEIEPDDLDLPTMPLGDSDEMSSGEDITILGFPGISESARITVTTGVVSTFIDRPDLGERSEIDTDARIAPGNSGGAAINNDAEIIGIPSAYFSSGDSPIVSGRVRPINFVRDFIDAAEESAR
ncbi:FHA domain-containing protein [Nocardioides sp.]|uniref:FHA domain-containing protein n=1 Tax=Nocardioides sp. TaxID=35761 RepID=UPI003512B192